jgi:hypothetical protein
MPGGSFISRWSARHRALKPGRFAHIHKGMTMNKNNRKIDANLQPVSRAPRAGPVGTGIATVVGGLAKCGPAYGFGVDARDRYPGRKFDDVESEMSSDWAASRGASILNWGWARHAARDAWDGISRSNSLCA